MRKTASLCFLAYGGDTPYLEMIMQTLQVIHQGAGIGDSFFSTLEMHGSIAGAGQHRGCSEQYY